MCREGAWVELTAKVTFYLADSKRDARIERENRHDFTFRVESCFLYSQYALFAEHTTDLLKKLGKYDMIIIIGVRSFVY